MFTRNRPSTVRRVVESTLLALGNGLSLPVAGGAPARRRRDAGILESRATGSRYGRRS